MKALIAIATAAALCAGLPAGAQTRELAVAPPATPGTGVNAPSISDTRAVDQNTLKIPSDSAAPATTTNNPSYDNWRTSSGFNADPNNPSGAPGPSSGLGTSR
jgi:hypothetical protein